MRSGLVAALVLGTMSFGVFALLSRAFFKPGNLILAEIPLALWLGCVAATYVVMGRAPVERVDGPTVRWLVAGGAAVGAFLAPVAAVAAAWPSPAVPILLAVAVPVGATFGAICALLGAALLAVWLRLRPRGAKAHAAPAAGSTRDP